MEQLPRYLSNTIESLPEKFQREDYLIDGHRRRRRVFGPKSFMLTMIQLVGSRAREGYDHALVRVFDAEKAPRKSAFSQMRSKISYKFFQCIFNSVIAHFARYRPNYLEMIIYAVDGWQLTLPRTKDITKAGHSGRKTSKYRESYMPKGFVTHAYDVLSETTKDIRFNKSPTELADALSFVSSFEKNSICLYDRAYFSRSLCVQHLEAGNYFIARCQSNANKQIKELFKDTEKDKGGFYYETSKGRKKVWLIKVHNPKTGTFMLFATNLPRQWRNQKTFDQLYQLRWGAETSFYELSETIKLQQWHSKSLNGILQELYTALLIINLTKILSFFARGQKTINPEKRSYKKPNFKLLVSSFLDFLLRSKPQLSYLIERFKALIKRSTERRMRRSRTNERVIKSPASPYKYIGSEWLGEKNLVLN